MGKLIPIKIHLYIYLGVFYHNCCKVNRGLRGRVVRVADSRSLAPHRCGFKSRHGRSDFSSEEASQLACGRSVVLPGCGFGFDKPKKANRITE